MVKAYIEANRRRWDECVPIHRNSNTGFYQTDEFLTGADILLPIESAEIGDVAGKRLLHLQCHFGLDTLCLARRGATVTGLDFSATAIETANALAVQARLPGKFIEGDVYDAPKLIDDRFDLIYVTWGAINWLLDIVRWARIVADLLATGGYLYLLEGHPSALALDQSDDGRLVPTFNYFQTTEPLEINDEMTYTGDAVQLKNTRTYEWMHPLSDIVNALINAGLTLDFLNEHDRLAWQLFPCMVPDSEGMYLMPPEREAIPLAFSLRASKN